MHNLDSIPPEPFAYIGDGFLIPQDREAKRERWGIENRSQRPHLWMPGSSQRYCRLRFRGAASYGFPVILPFETSPAAVETQFAGDRQSCPFGAGSTSGKDLHDSRGEPYRAQKQSGKLSAATSGGKSYL